MKNQYTSVFIAFFLCWMGSSSSAQSKKELLAQLASLQEKQSQWTKDSLALRSEITNLKSTIAEQQTQSALALANCEKERTALTQKTTEMQQIGRKNVEIFDLYSFGYQPLKNSDKEFESQKRALEEAIQKSRWRNVSDLLEQLSSPKRSDEEKAQLYTGFTKLYPELSGLGIADFKAFSAASQSLIRNAISKRTQEELKAVLHENIWIQCLDGRWGEPSMLLLKKY